MNGERQLLVSRRTVVLSLVGVCILSAAIGSGVTLLAKTGPRGERGPVGTEGPPGESAEDASYQAEEANEHAEEAADQADELESQLSQLEAKLPGEEVASWSELDSLEGRIADLESATSAICRGLEIVC